MSGSATVYQMPRDVIEDQDRRVIPENPGLSIQDLNPGSLSMHVYLQIFRKEGRSVCKTFNLIWALIGSTQKYADKLLKKKKEYKCLEKGIPLTPNNPRPVDR